LRGRHLRGDKIPLRRKVSAGSRQVEPHLRDDIVLRNALAAVVHEPENVLSVGVVLVGKGTDQSQGRRVVTPLVGGNGRSDILSWPSGYRVSKADGKHESGDGCLEGAVHPDNPR
jgi:hypothetical protein